MAEAKQVNHHYFDELNERSAWMLGFWAADGCVYTKKNKPNSRIIMFAQSDRELLEQIQTELESEHKLGHYPKNGSYLLQFCSTLMNESLCRIFGVDDLSRKSRILPWPINLPEELFWHFLRGVVDGDGCFRVGNGQPRFIITSGSQGFILSLEDRIEARTGIFCAIYRRADKRNWNLVANGINASIIAYELYQGATIWSNAKRQDAELALQFRAKKPPQNLSEITKERYAELIPSFLAHGRIDTKSGYRQVEPIGHKWRARLGTKHLGLYPTKKIAAMARDAAAIGKYGACAVLNFPEEFLNG